MGLAQIYKTASNRLDICKEIPYFKDMELQPEGTKEVVYRIDPFSIIFRELDLIHSEIREIKSEIVFLHQRIDETNKRIDEMNKRIDEMNIAINKRIDETNLRIDALASDINRRLDKLFLVVIINLIAIIGFLFKIVLDGLIK